ncbi:hypothetical protein BJY00DRAFT_320136 [Aspergillus carlsbadensis]|nr:hypothetical protein BJY00DRAFT_320136 [Aspergillus carlsbadensis]
MADPFSITGSAVGVVSLGLTICQGLLAYYGPYKSFHEEINEVASRVQSLNSLLTTLNDVIANSSSFNASPTPQPIQAAIQNIQSCSHGLQKLEKMSIKCRTSCPPGNRSRSVNQFNRLLYPFRQETLLKLMGTVTWLQDNLNTSLLLLQIASQDSQLTRMDLIVTKSSSAASDTSEIKDIATRLDVRHSTMEGTMTIIQNRLDQMESDIRASMARQCIRPDSLRQLLRDQQANDECFRSLRPELWSPRRNRRKWPGNQANKVISLIYRHTVCNRFLRFTLTASLTVTKSAGGCSISPNLQFRAIVPDDSPAFSLLTRTMRRLQLGKNSPFIIRETRTALFELFYAGEACLSDTLGDGNTIMNAVAALREADRCWEPHQWADWRDLIRELAEAGLSPNCVNDNGITPADIIAAYYEICAEDEDPVRFTQVIDICSDLLSRGSFIKFHAKLTGYRLTTFYIYWHSSKLLLPLLWSLANKCGPQDIEPSAEQLLPLILQSVAQLRLSIVKGVRFDGWISHYAQWHTGLEVLLQAGYKPDQETLACACSLGREDTVSLVLQSADFYLEGYALVVASSSVDPRVSRLIVEWLAKRRRQLQLPVQGKPSAGKVVHLGIRPDTPLDRQYFNARQLLPQMSVNIRGLDQWGWHSVYDTMNLSIQTAQQLWDAGFKDVDEADNEGYTSLMKLHDGGFVRLGDGLVMKKAVWLVDKGANMYRKSLASNLPAIFFLSSAIGRSISPEACWDDAATNLLYRILVDDVRDDCSCSCCANGCSALTKLMDGMFRRQYQLSLISRPFLKKPDYKALWKVLESFNDSSPHGPSVSSIVAPDVIRYITFIELEITHTCHGHAGFKEKFMSEQAVEEIQEEEEDIIRDHEALVKELCQGYADYSRSLRDYITEVARPRLRAFCRETVAENEANGRDDLALHVKLEDVDDYD